MIEMCVRDEVTSVMVSSWAGAVGLQHKQQLRWTLLVNSRKPRKDISSLEDGCVVFGRKA